MIPPDYFLEHCSYKADKYRQEKHFPNIVVFLIVLIVLLKMEMVVIMMK